MAALGLVLASSCTVGSPEPDHVAQLPLVDGRVVGDLLDSGETTIVLVSAPGDCFSCTGLLGRWTSLGRSADVHVKLVLTEEPTPRQTTSLAFLRVDIAGVLAADPPDATTVAYAFDGHRRTRSAVGVEAQVAMLNELTMLSGTLQ